MVPDRFFSRESEYVDAMVLLHTSKDGGHAITVTSDQWYKPTSRVSIGDRPLVAKGVDFHH